MTALLVSSCLRISQNDADEQAALVADHLLAPRLERELNEFRGGASRNRVQTIHSWLIAPDEDFLTSTNGALWVVGSPKGSAIPVTVYDLWTDTAFVNDSRWGRACREYDVGKTITTRVVTCPTGTPREPPANAVG